MSRPAPVASSKQKEDPLDQLTQGVQQSESRSWRDAIPHDRLSHIVREAVRGFTRCLQVRLAEHSVTTGHWAYLRVLWTHDGLTQRELALRTGLMESTTFTAVTAMEKLGYVRRARKPGKKQVRVWLTPAGHALQNVLVPLAQETNEIALQGVSRTNADITRRTLLAMIANFARDEDQWMKNDRYLPSTQEMSRNVSRGPVVASKATSRATKMKARSKAKSRKAKITDRTGRRKQTAM